MIAEPPIETGKFFKTPRHGSEIIFGAIKEYQGRKFADFRVHFTDSNGIMRPTKKGLAVSLRRLQDLANLINKTIAKARELGLLGQEPTP